MLYPLLTLAVDLSEGAVSYVSNAVADRSKRKLRPDKLISLVNLAFHCVLVPTNTVDIVLVSESPDHECMRANFACK